MALGLYREIQPSLTGLHWSRFPSPAFRYDQPSMRNTGACWGPRFAACRATFRRAWRRSGRGLKRKVCQCLL